MKRKVARASPFGMAAERLYETGYPKKSAETECRIIPFQTCLWERRTLGRPSCQEVYERVSLERYHRQDLRFRDRKYSRKPCISIFPSLSPIWA